MPTDSLAFVRVAVLASGSGTILEAMVSAGVRVDVVVADRRCRALQVAEAAGVEAVLVDRQDFGGFGASFARRSYTVAVAEALASRRVELVAMAGFGTVLEAPVHEAFPGRILNTHPSLLPAFPGWHAVEDALEAGVAETGCTVHVATLAMDAGPVLAQATVPVLEGDTVASLHERIKEVERRLYPETLKGALRVLGEGGLVADLATEGGAEAVGARAARR